MAKKANGDDAGRRDEEIRAYQSMIKSSADTIKKRAAIIQQCYGMDEADAMMAAALQDFIWSAVERLVLRLAQAGAFGPPPGAEPPRGGGIITPLR